MRGHEPLIAMRRNGYVPDIVWLDTEPCGLRSWAEWPDLNARHARVWIEPNEHPDMVDLYFVIGLLVHVDGSDASRVAAAAQACRDAKAKRVIVTGEAAA